MKIGIWFSVLAATLVSPCFTFKTPHFFGSIKRRLSPGGLPKCKAVGVDVGEVHAVELDLNVINSHPTIVLG